MNGEQDSKAEALSREALERAERVSVADFSTALSTGILRAMDQRRVGGFKDWRPWIWAGWMIGDNPWGPGGPFFDPSNPEGPGGPGGPIR